MINQEKAFEIFDWISQATRFYTTAWISGQKKGLTRYANSEIHQNMVTDDTTVTIHVFDGEKRATVSTNVLDKNAVLQALNSAELKLPLVQPSGYAVTPLEEVPNLSKDESDPTFDSMWGISARASAIGHGIKGLAEGYQAAGAFEVSHEYFAWGNSKGVRHDISRSSARLEVMVSHLSGASGYVDVVVKKAADLDVDDAFKRAYMKAAKGLYPVSIEPDTYEVVLEPMAVNDLVSYLAYLGGNLKHHLDGLSPYQDQVGKQVASNQVTLIDDPDHLCVQALPFDFEGYQRFKMVFIDHGILKNLANDTFTASKMGQAPTGHSFGYKGEGGMPLNIVMEAGESTLDTMISKVKKGLLVSRFHYMNAVDPRQGSMTALTRDGLFLIEEGQVTKPVKNLRFTDTFNAIFNQVLDLSSERVMLPSFFGCNYVPALRLKALKFTGKTEI